MGLKKGGKRMLAQMMVVGRVGSDPTHGTSASGVSWAAFPVAYDYSSNGSARTQWVRVAAFGRLAGIAAQYVQKGRLVAVIGQPLLQEWVGQDGQQRATLEIIARELRLLDPRPPADASTSAGEEEAEEGEVVAAEATA
jgi:single-strand DNA-binding protein